MIKMGKSSILYICGKKFSPILECFEWYEVFKNTLEKVKMEKNKIETPFAVIEIVCRKPLFAGKYDYVLNADKQDDDAKLFAIGIGKDY